MPIPLGRTHGDIASRVSLSRDAYGEGSSLPVSEWYGDTNLASLARSSTPHPNAADSIAASLTPSPAISPVSPVNAFAQYGTLTTSNTQAKPLALQRKHAGLPPSHFVLAARQLPQERNVRLAPPPPPLPTALPLLLLLVLRPAGREAAGDRGLLPLVVAADEPRHWRPRRSQLVQPLGRLSHLTWRRGRMRTWKWEGGFKGFLLFGRGRPCRSWLGLGVLICDRPERVCFVAG